MGPGTRALASCFESVLASLHLSEQLMDALAKKGMMRAAQEVEMPAIPLISSMEVLGVGFRYTVETATFSFDSPVSSPCHL